MTEHQVLPSGSTIGILGGGQLGRMLALAAARLGMKVHIFCPDADSCAFEVAAFKTAAAYEDKAALAMFAQAVDVITYEFENVPVESAAILEKLRPLRPGSRPLAIAQDRVSEKQFLTASGIAVAPWAEASDPASLKAALEVTGVPAVIKTARMGYDGKGQRLIRVAEEAAEAFSALGAQTVVVEKFIPFEREISVVVARNSRGQIRDYDAAENVHENHILRTSTVPASIDRVTALEASRIAQQIVGALDYVGVLGVEFFVVPGPERPSLLVNEIAPRVHNSGHWTEAGCLTDQFEQHIRAICNWPLGDPTRMIDVQMQNLLGDEARDVARVLKPGMQPHIYGKSSARPGRKMGHINHWLSDDDP